MRNICPVDNLCAQAAGELSPPCGTTDEHMAPLVPAEAMCVRALLGARSFLHTQIAETPTDTEPWQRYEHTLMLAWSELDLARALPDRGQAARHFETARATAIDVMSADEAGMRERIEAGLLSVYIPAFRIHSEDKKLGSVAHDNVRKGLAALYHFAHALPRAMSRHEDTATVRAGADVKISFHLLAERAGVALLPASRRERVGEYPSIVNARRSQARLPLKHDAYVAEGGTKVPIKMAMKKRTGYGTTVMGLHFRPFITGTMSELARSEEPADHQLYLELMGAYTNEDLIAAIPLWLVNEAQGQELTPRQQSFLDRLSLRLRVRINTHRARLAGERSQDPSVHHAPNAVLERLEALRQSLVEPLE